MASVEHTSYLGEWANVGFPWSNTARTWGQSQNIDIYSISLEETAVAKDVREVFLRLPIGVQVHGSDALKKIPMNVLGDSVHLKDIRLHNASYKRVFVEDTQCRSSYRYASWADDMPWEISWRQRVQEYDSVSWDDSEFPWGFGSVGDKYWDNSVWKDNIIYSWLGIAWNEGTWYDAGGYSWNGIVSHVPKWYSLAERDNQIKLTKKITENIVSHDASKKLLNKIVKDSLVVSEDVLRNVRYHRQFFTNVHCRHKFHDNRWIEGIYTWLGKSWLSAGIWDDGCWKEQQWSYDTFTWSDGDFIWSMYATQIGESEIWSDKFWCNSDEYAWAGKIITGLRWADCKYGNDSIKTFKNLSELATVDGVSFKSAHLVNKEKIISVDLMLRSAQFHRLFNKNTYVSERNSHEVKRSYDCNVVVNDKRVHNSNAVISDIIVNNKDIPVDSPAGYSEWIPFISGDYTYKDALMKCEIKSEENATVVEIPEYKVFVDLPDIIDKGTVRLDEAREKFVPFNIEFYQEPTVTITAMSVDSSDSFFVPVCSAGRLDGFFVKLVGVDGKLKTGMISWQAVGV